MHADWIIQRMQKDHLLRKKSLESQRSNRFKGYLNKDYWNFAGKFSSGWYSIQKARKSVTRVSLIRLDIQDRVNTREEVQKRQKQSCIWRTDLTDGCAWCQVNYNRIILFIILDWTERKDTLGPFWLDNQSSDKTRNSRQRHAHQRKYQQQRRFDSNVWYRVPWVIESG